MANSNVELDLLGLNNNNNNNNNSNSVHPPRPRLDRRQSFQGISRINPEIVKSVIESASKQGYGTNGLKTVSQPGSPRVGVSQLPVFQPLPFFGSSVRKEKSEESSPMTIFYNGTVSVFDLPKHEAESIMKFAIEKIDGQVMDHASFSNSETTDDILGSLNDGDMPIKRKKSLQRFFEKRKERLMSISPYYTVDDVAPIQKLKC